MPNFLKLTDTNLFPIPEYTRNGGKGGGGGGLTNAQIELQMRKQEEMMMRQMEMQQQYQREAESRIRAEEERQRQAEFLRREEQADIKEKKMKTEESQETALLQEMTGQTKQEFSEFGGGFNLAMPTIERPGYEREQRPE